SIFVQENDGLTLGTLTANSNTVTVDVATTTGNVTLGTISATGNASMVNLTATCATSAIVASNSSINANAGTANLTAGSNIGASATPINTSMLTLHAALPICSIFVQENDGLTLGAITANSNTVTVDLATTTGNITLGTINATG